MGEEVEAFEEEWAEYCKAKYCVVVSSGTDALYLAIRCLGITDVEILTTPFTFFATTGAIMMSGNIPRFVDVEPDGNIDIGKEPVSYLCALPVHLYGKPAKLEKHDQRYVIEDACQAHGLPLRGHLQCFSFYPTKNLGAYGQAGAIVTNIGELVEKLRWLRVHGEKERFVHYEVTGNYRMDELQASILRVKLPHLNKWNQARRDVAGLYQELLGNVGGITLPEDDLYHCYHIYAIRVKNRDSLARFLAENGIQTAVRYPLPMHLQPALEYLGYKKGDFPVAEEWAETNLSLPMYPELTQEQVEYVCSKIKGWVRDKS